MSENKCRRCGECCLEQCGTFGLHSGSDPDEAQKWHDSWDMLPSNFGIRFVDEFVLWNIVKDTIILADLFRNPNTGDEADRCPFLRKDRNKETYACLIHGTGFKPSVCKNYLCDSLGP